MTRGERRSVLASGFIALDVIQAPEWTRLRAGGTAANVAAILAYLGWRSAVVGVLGDDDAGPLVEQDLRLAGVDTSGLWLRPGVGTPLVLHQIKSSGHRFRFGCAQCGRAYRRHRPVSLSDVSHVLKNDTPPDVYFFDRPTVPALEMASIHRKAGRLVAYEPGSVGRPDAHRQAVDLADIVKYSEERLPLFADSLPGPRKRQLWIATAGIAGTRFRLGPTRWRALEALHVAASDAGGAGDWMTAALLTSLGSKESWTIPEVSRSIRHAQAIAALSCLVPGARTLADALTPKELSQEADRLAAGETPRLTYRLADESSLENRCPHCRLPFISASGAAS